MVSCSKPAMATKSTKKPGVVAKAKAAVNVTYDHFPIKCDVSSSSSDFHPFVSMDAQYGHSLPEESCVVKDSDLSVPSEHEFMDDKVESS